MGKRLFVYYPGCSTCRNARKWLTEQGIDFEERHITEKRPSESELREWILRSGLPLGRFFNTSGVVYKSLQLKDKLPEMSEEEKIRLLASDGKLIKRPLLVGKEGVLVGFKAEEWAGLLLHE